MCSSLTSPKLLASIIYKQGRWEEAEVRTQAIDAGIYGYFSEDSPILDRKENLEEVREGLHQGIKRLSIRAVNLTKRKEEPHL